MSRKRRSPKKTRPRRRRRARRPSQSGYVELLTIGAMSYEQCLPTVSGGRVPTVHRRTQAGQGWLWPGLRWAPRQWWHDQGGQGCTAGALNCNTSPTNHHNTCAAPRLPSSLNTAAARAAIMAPPMSGRCTGTAPRFATLLTIIAPPCHSQLGGIPGIPRVHYKGRQGDYYIMVRARALLPLATTYV